VLTYRISGLFHFTCGVDQIAFSYRFRSQAESQLLLPRSVPDPMVLANALSNKKPTYSQAHQSQKYHHYSHILTKSTHLLSPPFSLASHFARSCHLFAMAQDDPAALPRIKLVGTCVVMFTIRLAVTILLPINFIAACHLLNPGKPISAPSYLRP
jgi:hypothetical protein